MNGSSRGSIEQTTPHQTFEEVVLRHLDAAFNYARRLTKSGADAEDVVQDANIDNELGPAAHSETRTCSTCDRPISTR